MGSKKQNDAPTHVVKRCPECMAYMTLDARTCPACKKKVGDVLPHGTAEKQTNWLSYIVSILSIIAFVAFMYWLFFINE